MKADIVVDLSYGDAGKGKVAHHLLKSIDYTHCIRFNGSQNAGHTIYHHGKKIITHLIPAGVFFGVKSIIGPVVLSISKVFLKS
jgi:adenylosuccinate synthase